MNTNLMKRVLSLLLSLALLVSNFQVTAFAAEEETTPATEVTVVEETFAPTEATGEATEATAAPTEEATEPVEETTAPTEAATEPAEATIEPVAEETESADYDFFADGDVIASGTCGTNLTWTLDSMGMLTISGSGDMTIKSSSDVPWKSYKSSITSAVIEDGVTSVGNFAFDGCTGLMSIDLPSGLTSIGNGGVRYCSLTSINLPDSLTSIGWQAFWGCTGLTSIVIPDGVTSIGHGTFSGCTGLTSVGLPDGLTSIANSAFYNCTGLTCIDLPDSLTSIGLQAFCGCTGLTSIVIPDGVTALEDQTFWDCTSLTSIAIPDGVTSIGDYAFDNCTCLTSIDLPDSLTSIGFSTFDGCTSLTSVIIPSGVVNIMERAFMNCKKLKSVTLSKNLINIGELAFSGCRALKEIVIPRGVRNIGNSAFSECVSLFKITFEGDAPTMGEHLFYSVKATVYYPQNNATWTENVRQNYGGTIKWVAYDAGEAEPDDGEDVEETVIDSGTCGASLTWTMTDKGTLTISGTGTMIDYTHQENVSTPTPPWYAYRKRIKTLVIEDGVTSIGTYAFWNCVILPNIVIPDSVTRIGYGAFDDCNLLLTVSIGRGVKEIGSAAFQGCSNLADVYIYDPSAWCKIQFGGVYSNPVNIPSFNQQLHILDANGNEVTDIVLDNSVTTIPDCAFIRSNLTSIVIPNSVTKIGEHAFSQSKRLTGIVIPDGVASIEYHAFSNCDSLTSVAIPDSVTDIKEDAFYGCDNLKSIVLPEGLLTIGENAFEECALTELVIPDTVTRIDRLAFGGCNSLESVTFGYSVQQIGDSAFFRCEALKTIKFRGDAPEMNNTSADPSERPFYCVKAKAYYPEGNATWTKDKRVNYGGTLTWVPYAPEYTVASGTCGENLTWKLDSLGKLTVSGSGDMYSYTSETGTPWYSNRTQIKSVEIVNGVTGIGAYAFAYCPMESVVIPASVTSIGKRAFYQCNSLADAYIFDANAWCKVQFGDSYANPMYRMSSGEYRGSMHILDAAGNNVTELTLNDTVTEIPNNAFRRCDVTKVVIPDSVTAVGSGAFAECPKLESVTLGDNVTSIGNNAFNDCGNLKSINIPSSVASIGSRAFAYCGNLTSNITIPYGVTRIEAGTFADCFKIKVINVPDSVTFIGEDAFNGCNSLQEVNIPDGVTTIGQTTFRYCDNLKKINIPNSVTTIGWGAFSGCESLTSVVIPDSVTEIYSNAFSHCYGLESVVLPKNLTAISNSLFSSCDLKSIIIPEYVTSIGDMAFYGCDLTDVAIPAGVTAIGEEAFRNCRKLKEVVLKGNAPVIGEDAFRFVTATMYYSVNDPTWTEDILQDYGGKLTWVAVCTHSNTEILPAVDPTCTESGLTEGSRCTTCQEVIVSQQTIPALGHGMAPWEISKEVSCTEHGEKRRDCSRCDYFETQMIVMPGHTEVIDEGFPATCTEEGRTEGKHCAVCGEVLVAQAEIPALGHAYAVEKGIARCNGCGKTLEIRFTQEYVTVDLRNPETLQLPVEVSLVDLLGSIRWSIEGEEGIISLDNSGRITPLRIGTVHVVATLSDGFEISARCRVDVTDSAQIKGISLNTAKVTTELFSTAYAGFEVLLKLPQNYSMTAEGMDVEAEHKGIAIEKAVFADAATAEMFDLLVLDDRSLQIIPKDYAVNNPKLVKGSYKSAVTVTVLGQEHTSEILNLTVKKTTPKLTATVEAFNSFYSGQTRQIVIKNATPISIMATSVPSWLKMATDGSGVLTLSEAAPLKSTSGKVSLQVETEEWRIPATVNLTVKNTYKARGLKLSAASATAAENSNGIALKLLCTGKNDTLAGLNVTGIKATAGYQAENFSLADGSFTLTANNGFRKETVMLEVTFGDTNVTLPLNLKVKTASITLTPSAKTITLNKAVGDSATVTFTANPKDYKLEDLDFRLTTSKGVDKLNSGELEISENGDQLTVYTTPKTPEKESYKLYVRTGGGKEAAVTINVVSTEPTVTFKATGTMDLSFPNQAATVTPTFKNCSGNFEEFSYTVEELKGKNVVNSDVKDKFDVQKDGKTLKITCVDEDINLSNSYRFTLKLKLEDGRTVSNTVTLKVKRTVVKLKLSVAKLTLNKLANDKGIVTVTCTTKNYVFTQPVVTVKDGGNNDAANQLTISYANNKLTVATNDATVYGATYKISLQADRYAPAAVLTVFVPLKTASTITATIKVSGKLDVIRDSSAVTVTPTYKNRATVTPAEELFIYNAAGEDVSKLFAVTSNGKGGLVITKAEGAELPTGTYKVKLVADFGGTQAVTQKLANLSVTMGSAKLTAKTDSAELFADDKNDRVAVRFESVDKTLNGVAKVEIKDAKYQNIFKIYKYDNGQFAIGFAGDVPKNLAGQTVTLNLNVYLTGNTSAKPNTTVKVKLTIEK